MNQDELVSRHTEFCREAATVYRRALDPSLEGTIWTECLENATREVLDALEGTDNLTQIEKALQDSGRFSRALRFLLGPPLSQDQFRLACPLWPKASEKSGRRLAEAVARAFRQTFEQWRDPSRTSELGDEHFKDRAVQSTAVMIAQTEFATKKRMRLAKKQEEDAARILLELGYERVQLGIVDQPGTLGASEFAASTQFLTADGSSHEVDLAIGLEKRRILALECKVSNDKTNSVKRVNDVLKKAHAWKKQWGAFVITGALLQGVFSEKEPRRLVEAHVEVFWSHRLDLFKRWLEEERQG